MALLREQDFGVALQFGNYRSMDKAGGASLAPPGTPGAAAGHVPLARALSKLGLASRSQAIALVLAGRVRVDGRIAAIPATLVSRSGSRWPSTRRAPTPPPCADHRPAQAARRGDDAPRSRGAADRLRPHRRRRPRRRPGRPARPGEHRAAASAPTTHSWRRGSPIPAPASSGNMRSRCAGCWSSPPTPADCVRRPASSTGSVSGRSACAGAQGVGSRDPLLVVLTEGRTAKSAGCARPSATR